MSLNSKEKKNKKVIVLGGGTAGWFTALFARKFLSNDITVIENRKKGIVGVGEGTTPPIMDFLKMLDIHPYEVIANTGGTLKNGISFERWNKDSDDDVYFHPFNDLGQYNNFSMDNIFSHGCRDYYIKEVIGKKLDLKKHLWISRLSYENRVDDTETTTALHFDTFALGDYLSTKAKDRGIKHIDGNFVDAELDKDGFVTKVTLEDGRKYNCDFIFDCTGLSKTILKKKLDQRFISYSDTLAMKKALVIPKKEPGYFPYTKAIAMKYGWTFEIPLQYRIGRGYIFDSDYINETQAYDEVTKFYKEDIEVQKVISFDAGRMEKAWIKNCISVGLAQSFVEPLEATSIWTTIEMLNHLKHFVNCFENHNEVSITNYNNDVNNMLDNIKDFIRLHYISNRNDSDFWKEFPKKYKMSSYIENQVASMKAGNLQYRCVKDYLAAFDLSSWLAVGNGLNIFTDYDNNGYENIKPSVKEMKFLIDKNIKERPLMKDWLNKNIGKDLKVLKDLHDKEARYEPKF